MSAQPVSIPTPTPRARKGAAAAHWKPRTPKPDTVDLIPAEQVRPGDVMWLWRLPSSPLVPAWYRVVFVYYADHRNTTVAWLASAGDPVPLLLSEDHSVLVYRADRPPAEGS